MKKIRRVERSLLSLLLRWRSVALTAGVRLRCERTIYVTAHKKVNI
jgi:hypothetical protein